MKKTYFFVLCLLLNFSAQALVRTSGGQTEERRLAIQQYYDSGAYTKEIDAKLQEAWRYLDYRLSGNGGNPSNRNLNEHQENEPLSNEHQNSENLALVLDIDETALSNYKDLKRLSFTANSEAVAGAYMLGDSEAVEPTFRLYKYAQNRKVAIFFITGRPATPEIMAATTKNLRQAGYDTWTKLYLRPIDNDQMSIVEYKTAARKEITNLGYTIVLNIGDQEVDLKGGFAEANIKLPNPFYTIS